MSLTFRQWRFPTVPTLDGHAIGIRINCITAAEAGSWPSATGGSNYPGLSNATTFTFDDTFISLIGDIGPIEFTKHDPDGDLCMPKKDFSLLDAQEMSGTDGLAVTHAYDLFATQSSVMQEIFQDPSACYEIWLTDYSGPLGSPTTEVYFKGEIDYYSIEWYHRQVQGEFTANAVRLMDAKFTANSAIISLKQKPGTSGIPVPRTVQDLVNYIVAGNKYDDIKYLYCGNGMWMDGSLNPYYALRYAQSPAGTFPRATSVCKITSLLSWVAAVAGFQSSSIDTNMMFDFYGQHWNANKWLLLELTAFIGHTPTWDDIYVFENFLLGMPATDNPKALATGANGTNGVSTGTTAFADTTANAFTAAMVGFPITIAGAIYTVDTFTNSGHIVVSDNIPAGAGLSWSVTASQYADLFVQWGCTIPRDSTLDKLVTWICLGTGCYSDYTIDTSGNFELALKSRRTQSGTVPTAWVLNSGQTEEPTQVGQSSLIVQMQGDNLQAIAGPNAKDAVSLTLPWRCHKWGSPLSGGAFGQPNKGWDPLATNQFGFHGPEFQELWWDKSITDLGQQALAVKTDKSDDYLGDSSDPTDKGWLGGSMFFFHQPSSGEHFPSRVRNHNTLGEDAYFAVAAILPKGLALPTDEWLTSPSGTGSYFQPTTAYAQFYYQEIVGNKVVLKQRFTGYRGNDGKIQSVKPNIVMSTYIRGSVRTFISHALLIHEIENWVEVTWVEVLAYNDVLPAVSVIQDAGSKSSSSNSSSASSGSGTTGTANALVENPSNAAENSVTPLGDFSNLSLYGTAGKTSHFFDVFNSASTQLAFIDASGDATFHKLTSSTDLVVTGNVTSGTWLATTIDVPHGGTGAVTLNNHGVLVGHGTSPVSALATMPAGSLIIGTSVTTDPVIGNLGAGTGITISALSGSITVNNSGVTSNIAGSGITVSGPTGAVTISTTSGRGHAIYGDGSDGALVFDGTTTVLGMVPVANTYMMTRPIYGTTIVINAIATVLAYHPIFATVSITNSGSIINSGGNASGITGGTGTTSFGLLAVNGGAGATAGNSGNGTIQNPSALLGGTGGADGHGHSTAAPTGSGFFVRRTGESLLWGHINLGGAMVVLMPGVAGSGGSNFSAAYGGGGGAAGGQISLAAPTITNNGSINATGGTGAAAATPGDAGGGGGGPGGIVGAVTDNAWTVNPPVTTGGLGGLGSGIGSNATNGQAGLFINLLNQ